MVKRTLPLLVFVCLSTVHAGYDDGLISAGEYEPYVNWLSGTLVVDGGGATVIEARSFSQLEVRSTTPLGDLGGITDLKLFNYSRLDYYGGETDELTIAQNAKAYLYGGRIDYISNRQYASSKHIKIYACEGWFWKYENGEIRGITGLWYDSTPFNIRFTAIPDWMDYSPAWQNIEVITPEPTSLLLIAIGSLLLRRRPS